MKQRLVVYPLLLLMLVLVLAWWNSSSKSVESWPESALANSPSATPQDFAQGALKQWLALNADTVPEPATLAEGIRLARERMKILQDLARKSPTAARVRLFSLTELAALPEPIRRECERPWGARADFDLQWASTESQNGQINCHHQHVVRTSEFTMAAYGPHLLQATAPLKQTFMQGHQLGEILLLDPLPIRLLSKNDISLALQWFAPFEDSPIDPITGEDSSAGIPAIVAGKIHYFASQSSIDGLSDSLILAENEARENRQAILKVPNSLLADSGGVDGGQNEATPYLSDNINVLFIRVDFSDFPGEANSISKANLEGTLNTVANHINQYSYGAASLVHTVTPTLYRMPATGASYAISANGDEDLISAARNLASANYTLSNYNVIAVYFPSLSNVAGSTITYGGLASVGGGNHWINGANSTGVILHEFGHNYGLFHSNYWNPSSTLGGSRFDSPTFGSVEYGDLFDTMGGGSAANGYFSPFSTRRLGWLPPGKIVTPTGNGTWRISRFDSPAATSNAALAIRVPMGGGVHYWVGHRKLYGAPYNLSNGAYVVAEGLYKDRPNLIDMTPNSNGNSTLDRQDCGLPVGSIRYDANAGVRFETVASGGVTPNEWIDVNIQFDSRIELTSASIEVDEAAGLARMTLRRSFGGASGASVSYSTSNNTASAGVDYQALSGTVTWAAGDTADKTLAVPIRPDTLNEGVETFTLSLSSAVGAVINSGASSATISILDPGRRYAGFAPGFFNTTVNAIVPLADGKVIIGGDISNGIGDSPSIRHIARLNPNGSVDGDFLTGIGFNGEVSELLLQEDGKILVAGNFTQYDGTPCNRLIRLNANGTADTAFITAYGAGPNATIETIRLESSGKILVAGSFTNFDGQSVKCIVRLLPSGARDIVTPLTVDASLAVTSIRAILPLADGKVMIGGSLASFNYVGSVDGFRSGLARLEATGSRDASFEPGAGAHFAANRNSLGSIFTLTAQPDGKFLAGGFFERWNGTSARNLVRLDSAGIADVSFTGPVFDNIPQAVIVQPSGRIVVGGGFTGRLTRLTSSGATDTEWNPGGTPSGAIYTIAPSGSSLFIGGNFFSYAGLSSRPIVRIAGGGGDAYDAWKITRFSAVQLSNGQANPSADPDGDGLSNLLEMAIGSSPNTSTSNSYRPIFRTISTGLESFLEVEFTKGPEAASLWISGQFSNDLSTWLPLSPVPGTTSTYHVLEDSTTRLILRDVSPISSAAKRFARFHIQRPK